jgi:hypothetical protein
MAVAEISLLACDWNVLTSDWLAVLSLNGREEIRPPIYALAHASDYRAIASASPLDEFAAYRFLLTLLYWKAGEVGGVEKLRTALLAGKLPHHLLDTLSSVSDCFRLFDSKNPFLQDPSVPIERRKSVGYLFAEFATGTNIAHFHHGDDNAMRLCLRCATIGMLRVVPWTQSGGKGLSPSVHGAPPIMTIARGESLATTLALNLVEIPGTGGEARWTGRFSPTDGKEAIPFLEAFTWNPRRIYLHVPTENGRCWRCGQCEAPVVGPIVYRGNENTKSNKEKEKSVTFRWTDPAAFYTKGKPPAIKSRDEGAAAAGRDLDFAKKGTSPPLVVTENVNHGRWGLVVPCTNPANNKTYDHRRLELLGVPTSWKFPVLPLTEPAGATQGADGWDEPRLAGLGRGAGIFVREAVRLFSAADWADLSAAACREMHGSPAAFDVFSGLFWSLRGRKVQGLPSRNAAWLLLKLMAGVPARARVQRAGGGFCPLRVLRKRQLDERRDGRSVQSRYPVSFPVGHRLEALLHGAIRQSIRQRNPEQIDWTGLCSRLDKLLK